MEWPIEAHDYVRWLNSGYISGFSEVKLDWKLLAILQKTETSSQKQKQRKFFYTNLAPMIFSFQSMAVF